MGKRRLGLLVALLAVVLAMGVDLPYALEGPSSPEPQPLLTGQPPQAAATVEEVMNRAIEGARAQEGVPRTCNPPLPIPGGGTGDVVNLHCRVGPATDYFAEGKAMGLSDEEAHAYSARRHADIQEMLNRVLSTLPPPPR